MPLIPIGRRARVSWAAATLLLVLAAMHMAFAATFTVTPVRIYMKPQDRAVAVTITNESDTPVLLQADLDRKSTRLNSSHVAISYAVFCLKKKNKTYRQ